MKSQAIPLSAPAWYSKAVKKVQLSTTGEPKFTLRVPNVGGWGVQMTGTLHHANLSFTH